MSERMRPRISTNDKSKETHEKKVAVRNEELKESELKKNEEIEEKIAENKEMSIKAEKQKEREQMREKYQEEDRYHYKLDTKLPAESQAKCPKFMQFKKMVHEHPELGEVIEVFRGKNMGEVIDVEKKQISEEFMEFIKKSGRKTPKSTEKLLKLMEKANRNGEIAGYINEKQKQDGVNPRVLFESCFFVNEKGDRTIEQLPECKGSEIIDFRSNDVDDEKLDDIMVQPNPKDLLDRVEEFKSEHNYSDARITRETGLNVKNVKKGRKTDLESFNKYIELCEKLNVKSDLEHEIIEQNVKPNYEDLAKARLLLKDSGLDFQNQNRIVHSKLNETIRRELNISENKIEKINKLLKERGIDHEVRVVKRFEPLVKVNLNDFNESLGQIYDKKWTNDDIAKHMGSNAEKNGLDDYIYNHQAMRMIMLMKLEELFGRKIKLDTYHPPNPPPRDTPRVNVPKNELKRIASHFKGDGSLADSYHLISQNIGVNYGATVKYEYSLAIDCFLELQNMVPWEIPHDTKHSLYYTVNPDFKHDFFNKIDTHLKAYHLGFFAADGNVKAPGFGAKYYGNYIRICTEKSEKILLDKFVEALGINPETVYVRSDNPNLLAICVGSKEMVNDLIDKEIIPAKSRKLHYPLSKLNPKNQKEPTREELAFLLGYYDGDGTKNTPDISSGSFDLLQEIKERFNISNGVNVSSKEGWHKFPGGTYWQNKSYKLRLPKEIFDKMMDLAEEIEGIPNKDEFPKKRMWRPTR